MSVAYCYYCLLRIDECSCEHEGEKIVYGDYRVAYLKGYRDAKEGKEEDV